MGRGRAKAKQQKVARELKYNSQFTDLDALQRELGGSRTGTYVNGADHGHPATVADDTDDDTNGADDSDEYDDYEEDDRWTGAPR